MSWEADSLESVEAYDPTKLAFTVEKQEIDHLAHSGSRGTEGLRTLIKDQSGKMHAFSDSEILWALVVVVG